MNIKETDIIFKDISEPEILKLLYNYKNEDKKTHLQDYPLTNPDCVQIISKAVTDIIYNSNSKKAKDTITELLSRWIEPKSHIPIDESNCDIFIKCLLKEPLILDAFYQKYGQDFIKISTEAPNIKRKDDWKNTCETINKKYISSLGNKIKSGLIQVWNKNQFDKTNFDYNGQNKTFQNLDTENLIEFLKNLKSKPDIVHERIHTIEEDIFESISKFTITNISKEESSVQLGYALLNFEQNDDNEKLFLRVLGDISASRTESGLQFVEHIWTNKDKLQLSPDIYKTTLKCFQHLYEKPIITIATEILENLNKESIDYEYEIIIENSNIRSVFEICNLDLELCSNIIFVINKLLALSRFDLRIFKLLNIVRKYISTTYYIHFLILFHSKIHKKSYLIMSIMIDFVDNIP